MKFTRTLILVVGLCATLASPDSADARRRRPPSPHPNPLALGDRGNENTSVGRDALHSLTSGRDNTAAGFQALFNLTTASDNTAVGADALMSNTDGTLNSAVGSSALSLNTTGTNNTALGNDALLNNVSGNFNTAVGDSALSNSTGDHNTALGQNAGTDPGIGSNNVYVGDPGFPGDHNVISIGGIAASGTDYDACFIGGIYGKNVDMATAQAVYVDTDGHLGTVLSPVPVNAEGQPAAKRLPNGNGAKPQAMLNRNVKQQQTIITELKSTVAKQQKQIESQQKKMEIFMAQLKEQASQIAKVSARIEMSKPSPQVVANKP